MKHTSFYRWLKVGAVAVAAYALVFGVGCGKKDNGAPASAPPPPPPNTILNNCQGCPANGGFLASGIGTVVTRGIQLGLNFYGDNTRLAQNTGYPQGQYYNYGSGNYYGWVGASGTLVVQNGDVCAPAGTYSVQTEQAGTMSGTTIQGLRLVAQGPVQLRMAISGWLQASIPPATGLNGGNLGLANTTPFRLTGWLYTQPTSVVPQNGQYPYNTGYNYGMDISYCSYYPYGLE